MALCTWTWLYLWSICSVIGESSVECTRTYEGGCGNWGSKHLSLNYYEVHTVEGCYEKCAANTECGGFFLGTSTWHCLLVRAGCIDDNSHEWDYYAMDDCVTEEPTREPTEGPTEGPTEEPTRSPTKDCSALHIDEFLVDCSTEFDGHGARIGSLESGGSAMMDTVTGNSQDIRDLKAKMDRVMEHLDILGDHQTESGMSPVAPLSLDTSDYALYALAATNLIVVMCLAVYCVFVRATTPKYGKVAMYGTETEA